MGEILQLHEEHDEVQMLLPWHVNGTLDADEGELVEAHLAVCAQCRTDYDANVALRAAIAGSAQDVSAPAPPMPKLRARSPFAWNGLWRRPVSLGWALAGQAATAAAAVAAVALLIPGPRHAPSEYHLLAVADQPKRANLIVLFAPDLPLAAMRDALAGAGARIVDGPTASGAFMVRVDDPKRAAYLNALRGTPKVVLAEAIDPGP